MVWRGLALALVSACTIDTGTVVVTVEGNGTVTSAPSGFGCDAGGGVCTARAETADIIVLTAKANTISTVFDGWSGDCGGALETCTVDGLAFPSVQAKFHDKLELLDVKNQGYGVFRVTSDPPGIDCGSYPAYPQNCSAWLGRYTDVTLTATYGAQQVVFVGWHAPTCPSATPTCSFTLDGPRVVMPEFDVYLSLDIYLMGSGTGRVTGPGIDCAPDCRHDKLRRGELFTLHAEPAPGSVFAGWAGDIACTQPGPDCAGALTFNGAKMTAMFELQ